MQSERLVETWLLIHSSTNEVITRSLLISTLIHCSQQYILLVLCISVTLYWDLQAWQRTLASCPSNGTIVGRNIAGSMCHHSRFIERSPIPYTYKNLH